MTTHRTLAAAAVLAGLCGLLTACEQTATDAAAHPTASPVASAAATGSASPVAPASSASPVPSAPGGGSASPVPGGASASPVPSVASGSASPVPDVAASPVPSAAGDPSPVPAVARACSELRRVPSGASTVRIGDVDADGARDVLFLTTSSPWCFGVRTASRVIALADPLPASGTHRAWETNTDGSTGSAVVLDDGRTALVYRVRAAALQQLRTATGAPLRFPVGRTASGGTGVACNDQNGGILIEGSTARVRSDGRVDVLWANIASVTDAGVATVAAPEVRYPRLAATDARVAQAATSRCWASPSTAHTARG